MKKKWKRIGAFLCVMLIALESFPFPVVADKVEESYEKAVEKSEDLSGDKLLEAIEDLENSAVTFAEEKTDQEAEEETEEIESVKVYTISLDISNGERGTVKVTCNDNEITGTDGKYMCEEGSKVHIAVTPQALFEVSKESTHGLQMVDKAKGSYEVTIENISADWEHSIEFVPISEVKVSDQEEYLEIGRAMTGGTVNWLSEK